MFAANLRNLLLQPPLHERAVMGIDPGFRTGCKVATMDSTGKLLHTVTIYPHEPQNERAKARQVLAGLVELDEISVIAIGNGTASRETEALVAELIQGNTSRFLAETWSLLCSPTSWSARRARRSTPVRHRPGGVPRPGCFDAWRGLHCAAAAGSRWPSWSRSTRRASAWVSINTTSTRRSWLRRWMRWSSRWSTTSAWM